MGEEVQMKDQGRDDDHERVSEWEFGLPNPDDLTPLSQPLISPELASAFSISPEPYRTMIDVNRASKSTLSNLCIQNQSKKFPSFNQETEILEDEEEDEPARKTRRTEAVVEDTNCTNDDGGGGGGGEDDNDRSSKKVRLVWTPQLHKRFVDVVGHLGIKNAVPKTIMQFMNVEGLTRENVASHLQKYRLYLKRMQGLSNEGPSSSDPLFATTPVPQSLNESGGQGHNVPNVQRNPMPAPYGGGGGQMMAMPVWNGHGHMGMPVGGYHGMEQYHNHMYRDWHGGGGGNRFHSISSYPNVNQNDK